MTKIPFLPLVFCSIASAQISFDGPHLLTDGMQQIRNVITWDLDQDGDLDIIASNSEFELRVLTWFNDGDGNFEQGVEWTREDTGLTNFLSTQDYDQDGNLDFLMELLDSETDRGRLEIARGRADGTFETPTFLADVEDRIVAVHDLDGDDIPEILTKTNLYLGKHNWSFETAIDLSESIDFNFPARWDYSLLQFVNVDDDPFLEIVFHGDDDRQNEVLCLDWDEGDEPATLESLLALPSERRTTQVTFVPAKEDGPASLIVLSTSPGDPSEGSNFFTDYYRSIDGEYQLTDSLTRNNETELSLIRHWFDPATNEILAVYNSLSRSTPERPGQLVGNMEIFRLTWADDQLSGQFLSSSIGNTWDPTISRADLDGDQKADLIIGLTSPFRTGIVTPTQILWKAATSSEFQPVNDTPASGRLLPAEDIDGDGLEDLVTTATPGSYVAWEGISIFWKNNGDGTFTKIQLTDLLQYREIIATVDQEFSRVLTEGNDTLLIFPKGRRDFLVRTAYAEAANASQEVGLLAQAEDGSFHYYKISNQNSPGNLENRWPYEELLVDWNNDGVDELATFWPSQGGLQLTLLENPGLNQDPSPRSYLRLPFVELGGIYRVQGDVRFPIIADYNRDSIPDIITRGELLGWTSSYVMINDGTGNIDRIERIPDEEAFDIARQRQEIDLDGDLDPDRIHTKFESRISPATRLCWQENRSDLLFPDAPGHQFAATRFGFRDQYTMLDVNSDGTKELVVFSSDSSRLEYFLISPPKPGPADFRDWVASQGATGHSSSPMMDFDGDTATNWEEFLFGTNPTVPDRNSPQRPGVRMTSAGPRFTYHLRSDFEPGLSHQTSHDLINWMPLERAPLIIPGDDAFQEIQFPLDPNRSREFFKTTIPLPQEN